jgi:hypothetical protein
MDVVLLAVRRLESQPTAQAEPQVDAEAMRVLFDIVDSHRLLQRFRAPAFGVSRLISSRIARESAFEEALERGRRFLEARDWASEKGGGE